ncbi:hypothetical protein ACPA9J_13010 [Pseudomonas aeruginosa]
MFSSGTRRAGRSPIDPGYQRLAYRALRRAGQPRGAEPATRSACAPTTVPSAAARRPRHRTAEGEGFEALVEEGAR